GHNRKGSLALRVGDTYASTLTAPMGVHEVGACDVDAALELLRQGRAPVCKELDDAPADETEFHGFAAVIDGRPFTFSGWVGWTHYDAIVQDFAQALARARKYEAQGAIILALTCVPEDGTPVCYAEPDPIGRTHWLHNMRRCLMG